MLNNIARARERSSSEKARHTKERRKNVTVISYYLHLNACFLLQKMGKKYINVDVLQTGSGVVLIFSLRVNCERLLYAFMRHPNSWNVSETCKLNFGSLFNVLIKDFENSPRKTIVGFNNEEENAEKGSE